MSDLLTASLCPLSDNTEECQDSLPGFWAAMARVILPEYAEKNVCDMDTCQEGEAGVSILLYMA